MNIDIVGLGYVGLVSGVCLADKGHNVTCYDLNKNIINNVNKAKPHIYEPGLNKILKKNIHNKRFRAKYLTPNNNFSSNIIIIAVGTPSKNKKIDLNQIESACKAIAIYIKKNKQFVSLIIKSTIPPSTTDTYIKNIIEKFSKKKLSKGDFGLGMNPEFLKEGSAVNDFLFADRIVIGFEDKKTKLILKKMYEPWKCDKIFVNSRTAEMIKYSSNILLAMQISGANEIANFCHSLGNIDVNSVFHGVTTDIRWNPIVNKKRVNPGILTYLKSGPGFGGSCFPKDLEAFINISNNQKIKTNLFKEVKKVNDKQPELMIKLIEKNYFKLDNKKILILGLSFKPETDDIRESISIKIINKLTSNKKNIKIFAHDPLAMSNSKKIINQSKKVIFVDKWENNILLVDIIMILTNWTDYNNLELLKNVKNLKNKIIIDTRGMFTKQNFKNINYFSFNSYSEKYIK